MTIHFQRDMDRLHRKILSMFALVEETVHRSVEGLHARNPDSLAEILQRDAEINRHDVEVEEDCLKILALHQPVAVDLRRVTAVLKITGELERVGDLGVNIAERTSGLANYAEPPIPPRLKEMSEISLHMLHEAIDAFVELNTNVARKICADDDKVDRLNDIILGELKEQMSQTPSLINPAMHLFSVTRHLERIADHATNIAEDVVYLVEGEIIRHQGNPDGDN
ncbi:MAG: phosphate signaling complex protein PhoU [Planctomycetaceae bacterium]